MFTPFKAMYKQALVDKTLGKAMRGANEVLSFFERYVQAISYARFELFKRLVNATDTTGMTQKEIKELYKEYAGAVNTISGAAGLGRLDKNAPELGVLLFSARLLASKTKMLTVYPAQIVAHYTRKALGLPTKKSDESIRLQLRALSGIAGISASAMVLARLAGNEVDTNPTSSNFGKMKLRGTDTYFDLIFGYSSFIKLLAQEIAGFKTVDGVRKYVYNKEGELRARGKGGKELTRSDIILNFLRWKVAAVPSVVIDYLTDDTFAGEPPTVKSEAKTLITPLGVEGIMDAMTNEDLTEMQKVFASLFTFLGGGSYTREPRDWTKKETKEMQGFVQEQGEEKVKEASKEYDKLARQRIEELKQTEEFKKMSDAEKDSAISSVRAKSKQDIFKQYDYVYKPKRGKRTNKARPRRKQQIPRYSAGK